MFQHNFIHKYLVLLHSEVSSRKKKKSNLKNTRRRNTCKRGWIAKSNAVDIFMFTTLDLVESSRKIEKTQQLKKHSLLSTCSANKTVIVMDRGECHWCITVTIRNHPPSFFHFILLQTSDFYFLETYACGGKKTYKVQKELPRFNVPYSKCPNILHCFNHFVYDHFSI